MFRKKNKLLLRVLEAEGRRHPSYEEANGGQSQLEPETFTADTSQRHLPNDTEQIEIREREIRDEQSYSRKPCRVIGFVHLNCDSCVLLRSKRAKTTDGGTFNHF